LAIRKNYCCYCC